jgi:group I intron endonuclease
MYTIYKITNIVNNKVYIGQTRQEVIKRIKYHFNYLKRNVHNNLYLQKSYNKYGLESFKWEILENNISSSSKATEIEQYYMDKENSLIEENGYNLKNAGSIGKQLELTKDKIKKSLIENGKKNKKIIQYNLYTGEIISEWKSSKYCQDITGLRSANIIQHMNKNPKYTNVGGYGFIRYEDYLKNGIKANPDYKKRKNNIVPIICVDTNTNKSMEFISIAEAVRFFGLKKHEIIHRVLRGKRKKWKNYIFLYKSQYKQ